VSEPSIGDLLVLVGSLRDQVSQLRADNERLRARVVELEAQLKATSRNSSKPPSADGLGKPAPKSLRKKTGRRPGGQPGRPGRTLRQVEHPDQVVIHEPRCCPGCGADPRAGHRVRVERRQVFDLPPAVVEVTEHQLVTRRCRCGMTCTGSAPDRVAAPVQYGPRVAALIVYLYVGQFLSKKRTAAAVADLFGLPVAEGTVAGVTARAAQDLAPFLTAVRAQLTDAPLVHFDETGLRVAGGLHWLHSASTTTAALLHVHRRRGREGMLDAGVLTDFAGIAVHDAWAPYDTFPAPRHVLCNAHLLRELQAVIDTTAGAEPPPPGRWCWAGQVTDALLELKHHIDTGTPLDPAVVTELTRRIRDAATITAADTTNPGRLGNKHRALARRIRDRLPAYLAFTTDPAIPFDNNPAEREIRMVKIRQKVSGCLRTLTGAQQFAAIRSYTATTGKNGVNLYDALTQLTTGNPWQPTTT